MDGTDRTETWFPDGQVHAQSGPGPWSLTSRAVWHDGVLVLERSGGTLTIIRRLRPAPDGTSLIVDYLVKNASGRRANATLRYVGAR